MRECEMFDMDWERTRSAFPAKAGTLQSPHGLFRSEASSQNGKARCTLVAGSRPSPGTRAEARFQKPSLLETGQPGNYFDNSNVTLTVCSSETSPAATGVASAAWFTCI